MKMKEFDCVKMKHLGAEKVSEKTKGMTREQELKFWRECSMFQSREKRIMPRKIRELIQELLKAGFIDRGGKGSHRNFTHPECSMPVTLSGSSGLDDAKSYQEKAIKKALNEVKK